MSQNFKKGVGVWAGVAEVYGGDGRFIGYSSDQRSVQSLGEGRVRIDLNFAGPMALSGHYTIETRENYRLYQGPANVGYAEALDDGVVIANAYWADWGLSQRFALFVKPDQSMQMSLALMSRGEQLQYAIVGEYIRQTGDTVQLPETMVVNGISHDRANDPTNGRGVALLHSPGTWAGDLRILDAERNPVDVMPYEQTITTSGATISMACSGGYYVAAPHTLTLTTNGWQAWTPPGDVVGSYSIYGGRAMSGQFHHLQDELRVWRREFVSSDNRHKVIMHQIYRGGERVGLQYGLLERQS